MDTDKTTEPGRKRRRALSENSKRSFPYFGSASVPTIVSYSQTSNAGRLATIPLNDLQLESGITKNGKNPLHVPRRQTGLHAGDVGAIDTDLLGNIGLRSPPPSPNLSEGTAEF